MSEETQKALDDLIELSAHFESTHPIHRICTYLIKLSKELNEATDIEVNPYGDNS